MDSIVENLIFHICMVSINRKILIYEVYYIYFIFKYLSKFLSFNVHYVHMHTFSHDNVIRKRVLYYYMCSIIVVVAFYLH